MQISSITSIFSIIHTSLNPTKCTSVAIICMSYGPMLSRTDSSYQGIAQPFEFQDRDTVISTVRG